jgi:hypothetical protein
LNNLDKIGGIHTRGDKGKVRKTHTIITVEKDNTTANKKGGSNLPRSLKRSPKVIKVSIRLTKRSSIWIGRLIRPIQTLADERFDEIDIILKFINFLINLHHIFKNGGCSKF